VGGLEAAVIGEQRVGDKNIPYTAANWLKDTSVFYTKQLHQQIDCIQLYHELYHLI
jgi:hypothetical protein